MGTLIIGMVIRGFGALSNLLDFGQKRVEKEIAEINARMDREQAALQEKVARMAAEAKERRSGMERRKFERDLTLARGRRLSDRLNELTS